MNRKNIKRESFIERKKAEILAHKNQNNLTQTIKNTPQTIAAYERMMIFLDRIDLGKLVSRVSPISTIKSHYADLLISHINQEFEFNSSMELYISPASWATINTSKNLIIQQILKTALQNDIDDAYELKNKLVTIGNQNNYTELAKTSLKNDVASFL